MNKSKQKRILGRSMVEMLGTLALIGVLSIGSVVGFKTVMRKHHTNNLIEDVKFAGFAVVDGLFDRLADDDVGMKLKGKFRQETEYVFKAFAETETTFEVLVEGVSEDICEELKKRKVEWLEEIRANGLENKCKEEQNEMSFFFNKDFKGNTEVQSKECRANKDCPTTSPYCRNGYCSGCETGLQLNDGSCKACPTDAWDGVGPTTAEQCYICGEDYYFGAYSACYECRSIHPNSSRIGKNECARCPNRCWDEENKKCYFSEEGNAFINPDGTCNYACKEGQLPSPIQVGIGFKCQSCPTDSWNGVITVDADTCHNVCGKDYYFDKSGGCRLCSNNHSGSVHATQEECDRCPNRCWDEENKKCYLSEEENAFINPDGTCNYACKEGQLPSPYNNGFKCQSCPTDSWNDVGTVDADTCHNLCGKDYYFDKRGGCRLCSNTHPNSVYATQEECDRCPSRCWDEENKKCYLSEEGNAFINPDGTCNYACKEGQVPSPIPVSAGFKCV